MKKVKFTTNNGMVYYEEFESTFELAEYLVLHKDIIKFYEIIKPSK